VKVPSVLSVKNPCAVVETRDAVRVEPSTSESFWRILPFNVESSSSENVSLIASGASFIETIIMLTVAVSE
jgi:hypothetical protein